MFIWRKDGIGELPEKGSRIWEKVNVSFVNEGFSCRTLLFANGFCGFIFVTHKMTLYMCFDLCVCVVYEAYKIGIICLI